MLAGSPAMRTGVGDEFGLGHRAKPQRARHSFADGFAAADFMIGARFHAGGAQGGFHGRMRR